MPTLLACYLRALDNLIRTSRERGCPTSRRPAKREELQHLRSLGVREPVLSLFGAAVLTKVADYSLRVKNVEDMLWENRNLLPGHEVCPLGFIVIASTCSGDVFALDYYSPPGADGSPSVLLISHGRHWKTATDVVANSTRVAESLVEFLELAAADKYAY